MKVRCFGARLCPEAGCERNIMASKPDKDMGPEVKKLGGYRPGARLSAGPELDKAIGYYRHVEILICSPGNVRMAKKPQREKLYAHEILEGEKPRR